MRYFVGIIIVCAASGLLLLPAGAEAARLHFRTEKTSYKTGESGFATLNIDTESKTVNAVEATVSFNPELVEVTKITTDKSIINLWVQSARLDAKTGSISLKGVILNPGYKGNPGRIIGFDFKAKAPGTFPFTVNKMTVLANDGKGSSVKTSVTARSITVNGPAPLRNGVNVSSTTHPKQTVWYAKNSASILWSISDKAVTGVAYLFDQNSKTDPGNAALTTFKSAVQRNLASGVWFAHVRGKTASGWLATQHYKVQVDLDSPSSNTITILPRQNESFLPVIRVKAQDALSGIAGYELFINDVSVAKAASFDNYRLRNLRKGKNTITIKAMDQAGNSRSASVSVLYNPLPGTKATPQTTPAAPKTTPKANPTPAPTTPKIKAPVLFD